MSWDGIKDYQEYIGKSLKMPFGKYKGMHPSELPIEYCRWLRKEKIDAKIGKYFKKCIGSNIWHDNQKNKNKGK